MTGDSEEELRYQDSDTREAVARYRARYSQYAESPETLGWRPTTQEIRFAAFFSGFQIVSPESMVDIGCGFGDLLAFLRARGWAGNYQGIDIVPEFVATARRKYAGDPKANFHCGDFMEQDGAFVADACFASGLLNHKRARAHEAYVEKFIAAVARSSRRYAAIDFLSDTADRRRDDLFFHNAEHILQFGLRASKRAEIDHAYMPYEFMLKLWFPEASPAVFAGT